MRDKLSLLLSCAGLLLLLTSATLAWGSGGHKASAANPTPTVIAIITVGSYPCAVTVDSTRNRIYVANCGSNTVSLIDGATNGVTDTVDVGSGPRAVAVDPAANRLYVSNELSNTISVIDLAATPHPTVVATVAVELPYDLAVNPGTHRVYVAGYHNCTVSIIDGAATPEPTVVATVAGTGDRCCGVAFNPAANQFYLGGFSSTSSPYDGHVAIFNASTYETVTSPEVGSGPWGMAVNPNTSRVWVANHMDNSVSVIDAAATPLPTVAGTVAVGNVPVNVAVDASTNRIYVANHGTHTVSIVDGAASPVPEVVAAITLPDDAWGIAVNPSSKRVYISNISGNNVYVIQDFPIPPVGGIAELPDAQAGAAIPKPSQSAPDTLAIAGLAAGSALLLVAAGWYARRRWRW